MQGCLIGIMDCIYRKDRHGLSSSGREILQQMIKLEEAVSHTSAAVRFNHRFVAGHKAMNPEGLDLAINARHGACTDDFQEDVVQPGVIAHADGERPNGAQSVEKKKSRDEQALAFFQQAYYPVSTRFPVRAPGQQGFSVSLFQEKSLRCS
jgi:hypothetical protein